MKKAAIYARYSSDNQREENLQNQIDSCEQYAAVNDFLVEREHIYTDAATSGTLRERAGLSRLRQAAKDKLFDVVLVDDLSRLSRNISLIFILIEQLHDNGVDLHSVAGGLGNDDEDFKLLGQIKCLLDKIDAAQHDLSAFQQERFEVQRKEDV